VKTKRKPRLATLGLNSFGKWFFVAGIYIVISRRGEEEEEGRAGR
jgi:hypothetical protein